MNFQDCEKEVTNNGMYTVCLSIMWGTNVLCARNKSHHNDMWLFSDDGSSLYKKLPLSEALLTDMLPILILFAGFNVLDVIAHVIRGKLNDAPTSIPLRSTHLCILMFMIVDAAVILILMCRNIVNVAIQIAQLL